MLGASTDWKRSTAAVMTPSTTRFMASIPDERSVSEGSLSFKSLNKDVSVGTTCFAIDGNSSNSCGNEIILFKDGGDGNGFGVVARGVDGG